MIPFEVGDKVKVIGQGIVGDVIDINYGDGTVTIRDSYAESWDDELTYKADELAFVDDDSQEDADMDSIEEMRDMEFRDNGYKWEDWN